MDDKIAAVGAFTPKWNGTKGDGKPEELANGFRWAKASTFNQQYAWVPDDQQEWVINSERTYDVTVIHAGSLFRREALQAVGGYATSFSPAGHREETDLYCRLYFAGYRLLVCSGARMWHFAASRGGSRPDGADDSNRRAMVKSDEIMFQARLTGWMEKHPDKPITILK